MNPYESPTHCEAAGKTTSTIDIETIATLILAFVVFGPLAFVFAVVFEPLNWQTRRICSVIFWSLAAVWILPQCVFIGWLLAQVA